MNLNFTGKTIAKLRRMAGFTQSSLAERLGISDKAVSKWERGIACPDVSLWNKLSILLDTDIESLIYGHEVENKWHGILILDNSISADTIVYNKPLIHYLISQFLLVGITEIAIVGACQEIRLPGVNIYFLDSLEQVNQKFRENLFIVLGNTFIYGPNVTKHFKRAMSRKTGKTIIALMKHRGKYPIAVDEERKISKVSELIPNQYYAEPFVFISGVVPCDITYEMDKILNNDDINVETMVRGMLFFHIKNYDDVLEMAEYVKIMEKATGERIACIEEILVRRGICDLEAAKKISDGSIKKYLKTIFE